jgi:hypothetical protein
VVLLSMMMLICWFYCVVSKKTWFCVESFVHFLTFFVFVLCSSFVLYALMLLSCLESLEPLGLGKEILSTRKEIFLHITKFSSIFLWIDHQIPLQQVKTHWLYLE